MYLEATTVIAVALVVLVLVFVRISWTLKDIHEALVARGQTPSQSAAAQAATQAEKKAAPAEAAADENELAAVIAVAHAALARGA
jgi:uncharacterized membrane protein